MRRSPGRSNRSGQPLIAGSGRRGKTGSGEAGSPAHCAGDTQDRLHPRSPPAPDVTEDEIIQFAAGLPGVEVLTASEATGAPEVAWGDSFFYYDPDQDIPADRRFPFATIVVTDYMGFDEASNLDRDGVFRLNISVGRQRFDELIGHPPAHHAEHEADFDYAASDKVIPHPLYAKQAWVSILNPGEQTGDQARTLITEAHSRAAARHRPRP